MASDTKGIMREVEAALCAPAASADPDYLLKPLDANHITPLDRTIAKVLDDASLTMGEMTNAATLDYVFVTRRDLLREAKKKMRLAAFHANRGGIHAIVKETAEGEDKIDDALVALTCEYCNMKRAKFNQDARVDPRSLARVRVARRSRPANLQQHIS